MLNVLCPAIWICISIESIHNDSRQLECSTGIKKRLLSWCLEALSGCRSVGGRKFDEMSTLSLMINDQCSRQFNCFTKSLFWGGFLHATLALEELMWQVESFHQKVYLCVIQVSDRTFSLNHNQVSAWGQSGLGTSSQEWVRGGGCHLPAPDWHRSPAGDQSHSRRENDPEQIGFIEHVWQ